MGTCRIHFNKALDDGGQADDGDPAAAGVP